MRKIERQIISCLRESDFLAGNHVYYSQKKILNLRDSLEISRDRKSVQLWGNCIFSLSKENNISFSFRGWQTSTTKGRINALLGEFSSCSARIYQKNYKLIFASSAGEFPIDSGKIYTIKNGKPEAESI